MKREFIIISEDGIASLTACLFEAPAVNLTQARWAPQKRPALLIAPGGGYAYCSEREADPVAVTFSQAGYQTFVLRYHCGEASAYPAPLLDIARALAYIRLYCEAYGVDEHQIAVIGFSAGGHLGALLGACWRHKALQDLAGLTAEEMRPDALLLGYPLVDLKSFVARLVTQGKDAPPRGAMIRQYQPLADPLALVSEDNPPTYLFHTLHDQTILPADTLAYLNALIQHNVPCEYHLFSVGGHGLSTCDDLSCFGWDYPARVHAWAPLAIAWLSELFQGK